MDVKKLIERFALENAVHHDGKCNPGSVIAKVIGSSPEFKDSVKDWSKHVGPIVAQVNKLTVFEQTEKLKADAPELLEKKTHEKKEDLKPLPDADPGKPGQVVLRFEPAPSGMLHLGHTFALVPNSEYAKMYRGKLILRISDTNPEEVVPESYKLHEESVRWLTDGKVDQVVIQSDRMESYYGVALKLLEEHHAYVCECSSEGFKTLIDKGEECPCRSLGVDANVKRWHRLFLTPDEGGYVEGDAVVRLKTDVRHKNPAMRDIAMLRICDFEHPRQGKKYRVWPLMNLAVATDDHEMGLTHVLRGKDHLDNTKRQMYIYDYMKWKPPVFIHNGKVQLEGIELSKRKTKAAIEEGRYEGWDDIRLPTLLALRRRGYQPGAFVKFVRSMGMTAVDKRVEAGEFFKTLNFFNKEIVEPLADRFFFVEDPKEVAIDKAPEQELELDLHPDLRKKGRKLHAHHKFYLSQKDLESVKDDKLYRLMHCLNFTKKKGKFVFDSADADKYSKEGEAIFHWLPVPEKGQPELIKVKLIMDDGSSHIGLAEPSLSKKRIGDIVQFERTAFARYDHDEDNVKVFWYLHR